MSNKQNIVQLEIERPENPEVASQAFGFSGLSL
jgi:hypothetical protein